MDSRINFRAPTGPRPQRRLGGRSSGREQSFMLPRNESLESSEEDGPEPEAKDDAGILSPQPRRSAPAVSRTRLEDEAGQVLDLRG